MLRNERDLLFAPTPVESCAGQESHVAIINQTTAHGMTTMCCFDGLLWIHQAWSACC